MDIRTYFGSKNKTKSVNASDGTTRCADGEITAANSENGVTFVALVGSIVFFSDAVLCIPAVPY